MMGSQTSLICPVSPGHLTGMFKFRLPITKTHSSCSLHMYADVVKLSNFQEDCKKSVIKAIVYGNLQLEREQKLESSAGKKVI